MLYPDYDTLSEGEKRALDADRNFITDNTDAIHEKFEEFGNPDSPKFWEGASEQKILKHAIWHTKVEKYFKLLHPDYATLPEEEQFALGADENFIIKNTDAIHEKFEDFSSSDSPRYMEGASEQEKIQRAIEETKNEINKITPQTALKTALGTATTALTDKMNEPETKPGEKDISANKGEPGDE